MGRLILVEGIPGSGKTTIAAKIANYLSGRKKTSFYEEGASHPADLAWCACIPTEQLDEVFDRFPDYNDRMLQHLYREEGYAIIPYTRFTIEDPSFYQLMESFEVYDNRVGFDTFMDLHTKKWIRFGEQKKDVDEYIVFECAYLQNHINESLLFQCKKEKEIREYLIKLIETVKDLNPVMIYLSQPDVEETIRRVSEVRVDESGEKAWSNRVISYIENTPYGQENSLKGFEGMVDYFKARKNLELAIIKDLPMETHSIDNPNYDWETVWEEVLKIIDRV
jgi:hypothetical protein